MAPKKKKTTVADIHAAHAEPKRRRKRLATIQERTQEAPQDNAAILLELHRLSAEVAMLKSKVLVDVDALLAQLGLSQSGPSQPGPSQPGPSQPGPSLVLAQPHSGPLSGILLNDLQRSETQSSSQESNVSAISVGFFIADATRLLS